MTKAKNINVKTNPSAASATGQELVSMFVMAYNQVNFIAATVRSAFAQTYDNLEIILSDDCSSDGTYEIMERLAAEYQGPHQVRLNRNHENLGFVGHLNSIFDLCEGVLIVYAPGDDISHAERAAELYQAFREDRPLLVHSDVNNMDEKGNLTGVATSRQSVLAGMDLKDAANSLVLGVGASCAWNPEIQDRFGPVEGKETFDDLIFFFRAMLLDRMAHVPKALVDYRLGAGLSRPKATSFQGRVAQERKNCQRAVDTYRQRLKDCRNARPECSDVLQVLRERLAVKEYMLGLFESSFLTAYQAAFSMRKLKALLSLLNRIRRATPSRQKKRLRQANKIV
ncbi:glycosyltransferase [Sulfitobacter sp. SK011]|uniref:glycosyltransferase n=1 Tax=Sulfitobacter sp. SK011 TaxID=1389004 RepID=UPI000E0C29F8|nr:glycosyltransferase [Sulfitobacter sp. SK011]AXI40690.1 hypothetical protein C1J02_00960 [Sulfitobacter sp. SK011]